MNNQDALLVGKPLREIQDDTPVSERAIRDDEDGIDLLPDEVLAIILEQVHKSANVFVAHVPVRLSHVNRRFREVALNCPKLWTSVSCFYKSKLLRLFLKRIGNNTGLSVLLEGSPPASARQWRQIYAFSHRWENVSVVMNSFTSSEQKIWPFSEPLELPRLNSLRIVSMNFHNFSLPWDTPNIRLLSLTNSKFSLPINIGAGILSFTLAMHDYTSEAIPQVIAAELRQMPNLVRLFLSLNRHTIYTGPYDPAELPCLTSLSVEMRQVLRNPIPITSLIRAPDLRKMNIMIRGYNPGFDINRCNDALFLDSVERFPMLQGICYVVVPGYSNETGPVRQPNNILQFLTGREMLERVSLQNPYEFGDSLEGQFPIIRSLLLSRCHGSINRHLEKILKRSADAYIDSKGTRGLKCLRIYKCPDIDMVKIRELVPADRITVNL